MDIVQRVQSIILKPKEEWVKIKAEPATVAGLFTSYAMVLAAIPAGARFLGNILVRRLPMGAVFPLGQALVNAIVTYVYALAAVFLFALIISELAPNFGSAKNLTAALKLSVYSMTPVWVAGILNIIPGLWIMGILAGLYGLYLLYLGFDTPMMETPKDKVMGYMGVSIVVAIVLFVVLPLFLQWIFAIRYSRL
jgi:hypothetical protein